MSTITTTTAASPTDGLPSLAVLKETFLKHMRMNNNSPVTVNQWNYTLGRFLAWCAEHGVTDVTEITPNIVAAYRRHLYHHRNARTMQPIKFSTQLSYLMSVRRWFFWMDREEIHPNNIASKIELPKEEQRLPGDVLTASEVERILNQTDIQTPIGLRDRAIIETLYSTAMRCGELCNLEIYVVMEVARARDMVEYR